MNAYLTKHQYQNAWTEDLWSALQDASRKPVAAMMTTWTKQMGFPVLKVRVAIETKCLYRDRFMMTTWTKQMGFPVLKVRVTIETKCLYRDSHDDHLDQADGIPLPYVYCHK